MHRDDVLRVLTARRDEIRLFGVQSLALFGSFARDEAGPESDADLLVTFEGPATFDKYMGLKLFLEDLLGRSVDLVTPRALKPRLKERIAGDLIYAS